MEYPPTWTVGLGTLGTKLVPVPPGPGRNPYPNGFGNPAQYTEVWLNPGEYGQVILTYAEKTESDAWTFNNQVDPPFSVYRQRVWPVNPKLDYIKWSLTE